jgi:hypothetical protein
MSTNNTNKQPTHRAYAVSKHGERAIWRLIGAAWAHGDGEGFTLKLDLVPAFNSAADIVIRKPREEPGPTLQPSTVTEFA